MLYKNDFLFYKNNISRIIYNQYMHIRFELKLLIVTAQIFLLSPNTNLVYLIQVNKLLQTDEINSSTVILYYYYL